MNVWIPGTPEAAGDTDAGAAGYGFKRLFMDYTNTTTVGAVTINKAAGRVIVAAGQTSVVVTDDLVTAASLVLAVAAANDANASFVKAVVAAAGSFTIYLSTAPAANLAVNFFVVNTDA